MSSNQPITKRRVGAILLVKADQTARPQTALLSLGNTRQAIRNAPQTEAAPQGVPECHQEGGLPMAASPNRFLRRLECSQVGGCPENGVKTSSQPSSGGRGHLEFLPPLLRSVQSRTHCWLNAAPVTNRIPPFDRRPRPSQTASGLPAKSDSRSKGWSAILGT